MAHDYLHRRTRARSLAPWQPLKLDDARPPNLVEILPEPPLCPERAPGPRRAPEAAYRVSDQSSELPAVEDLPAGAVETPSRAAAAARAAGDAYFVRAETVAEERQPELGDGYFDETPRPRRRAAADAYWAPNLLTGEELPPPGDQQATLARNRRHPAARERAAHEAYRVIVGPPLDDDAMPPGWQSVADPGRQHGARRASPEAYASVNRLAVDADAQNPAAWGDFAERAPGPRRTAAKAYEAGGGSVDLLVDGAPGPGCPVRTRRQEEDATRRPRREAGDERALRPQTQDERRPRRDECR